MPFRTRAEQHGGHWGNIIVIGTSAGGLETLDEAVYAERARETEVHIERIRTMLLSREPRP